MKKLILILCLLSSACAIHGQDLIVFTNGDSLNCKITKLESKYIYFTYLDSTEAKQTLSSMDKIVDYRKKYFENSLLPSNENDYKEYDRYRFAFNYGYSYRTAKTSNSVPQRFSEYMEELKSGYNYGGSAVIYLSEYFGMGIAYNSYRSDNIMEDALLPIDNGELVEGVLSDDISINTLGMVFSGRFYSHNKRNAFLVNATLGYTKMRNEGQYVNPILIEGANISSTLDVGYDFGITKELAIGVQVSYMASALAEYTLSNRDGSNPQTIKLDIEEYESLHRLDLNIGLRLTL